MKALGVFLVLMAFAGMPSFLKATQAVTQSGGDPVEWTGRLAAMVLVAGGGLTLIGLGYRRKPARVPVRWPER